MKHLAIISVLAASQCAETADSPEPPKQQAAPDAGPAAVDAGEPASIGVVDWLEAGPPPFQVPTRRLALPDLNASLIAPVGAHVEKVPGAVHVKLGEGRNFWLEVTDAAVDLADVRAHLDSETSELNRDLEDVVLWNEDDRWYFQYAGTLACSNPTRARHDRGDVDVMIASCRSLESSPKD